MRHTAEEEQDLDDGEHEADQVHTIDHCLAHASQAGFKHLTHLRVLMRVGEGDSPYRHELIEALGLGYMTVMQALKRMDKLGIIAQVKDKRTKLIRVQLTTEGELLFNWIAYGTGECPAGFLVAIEGDGEEGAA